jgi:hypothetical protein
VDLEEAERLLRDRLDAIGPTSRAVLQHTLMLPDHERARSIGDLFSDPRTHTFAQLLIDLEEPPRSRGRAGRASGAGVARRVLKFDDAHTAEA